MADLPPALAPQLAAAQALHAQGQFDQALAQAQGALSADPHCAAAHYMLGNILQDQGRLEEAITAYARTISLAPAHAAAHNNLANVYLKLNRLDDAQAHYLRALAIDPSYVAAQDNLGVVLHLAGRLEEASACYSRALALQPDHAPAYDHLACALKDQGRADQAVASWLKALEINPHLHVAHSNLLLSLHYLAEYSPEVIFAEHQRWADVHARALAPAAPPLARAPHSDGPLRIGYVSGDFKGHVVAFFLEPILRRHDHQQFHITCYSQVASPDAITARFRSYADCWHDTSAWTDDRLAEQIRADAIDILIDLSGHTAANRLLVFARKPAPLQLSYLGYPDTTGLRAIDYRLTDPWLDPPDLTDAFFSERLVRLPRCSLAYDRGLIPDVAPLPALTNRRITFGSFNAQAKVSPATLRLWTDVLMVVPGSRLLLKSTGLNDPATQNRIRGAFAGYGISADRLDLRAYLPSPADHLNLYSQIDIALDTYPYTGTTTTCEALSMGVPVITLAGRTCVSRTGVTLLTAVGLPQFIATTPQEYLRAARTLAADLPRLAELRAGLRTRIAQSPLYDADSLTRTLESTYRTLWKTHCATTT